MEHHKRKNEDAYRRTVNENGKCGSSEEEIWKYKRVKKINMEQQKCKNSHEVYKNKIKYINKYKENMEVQKSNIRNSIWNSRRNK